MKHRHLVHEDFTHAAIEEILARGKLPDWIPLMDAINQDPFGEVATKTEALCDRPLFAAPVFRRFLHNARNR